MHEFKRLTTAKAVLEPNSVHIPIAVDTGLPGSQGQMGNRLYRA